GMGFGWKPARHDRGEKHVLGHTMSAGRGIEDGEEVLDILAGHPLRRGSSQRSSRGDVFRDGDPCPISEIRRHSWPQRDKDTEKNTLQVARSTRRRAAAGEACLRVSVSSVACPNQYVGVITK